MKVWDEHSSWQEAEAVWDLRAKEAKAKRPLRTLKVLPDIPGIVPKTAEHLKWKSFKYMLFHPEGKKILRYILRHPFRYGRRYLGALGKKSSFTRDEDFFLYGLKSVEEFVKLAEDSLIVVGFSYCQKPHECPSGRFTADCIHDAGDPVCQQCDIGKVWHALPGNAFVLWIPTIHYIGEEILKLREKYPKRRLLFLITACELTLTMFGDWGHMAGIEGIGVRLDGRICNTMEAFELSERGIKPGLTVVTEPTQKRILELIQRLRSDACGGKACCLAPK